MSTSKSIRERLAKVVEWHRQQAEHPIDVSGSDRARAHSVRFHEDAAKCIEALVVTIKDDALAYIDAADELYSACVEKVDKRLRSAPEELARVDRRQRFALEDFARASNQWAQHPRKCST